MAKFLEKTKEFLNNSKSPITQSSAKILAISGKISSLEERKSEFINNINGIIVNKARASQFRYLVEVPEDLLPITNDVISDLKERGFNIHTLEPKIEGMFVVNWK